MKKKALLTSILTIALCLSLIAGSTFALFTSESSVNIAVTAGKVKVTAGIGNLKLYSMGEEQTGSFENGGTATYDTTDATKPQLILTNITPGDKVTFDITGANESNVTIQYRVKIACTEGTKLMSGLNVTIGTETTTGLVSYASKWATLNAGTQMPTIPVAIELPVDAGNEYQNITAKLTVVVEAIQGNAETFNDANAGMAVKTETVAGKTVTAEDTVITSNGFVADIPEGTILKDGATTTTLNVIKEEANAGNFDFAATGAETICLDISIPEVAADNTTPITITLNDILEAGLNGVMLYHKGVAMTPVASAADVDADGEFFYDATTGDITLATTNFSNFTVVVLNYAEVADEAALTKAINEGKNVVLTGDITLTKTLLIKKPVVIDLNGHAVNANLSANTLFQSSSDTDPSVLIFSSESGAKINAGDKSVILGYGSTTINNVEINVGTVKSSSLTPFNVYGNLNLGEGTVVNVEFLGTSLISNNGAIAIAIDGAAINVGTFKANSPVISLNNATTVALNNAYVKIGTFVLSQFGGDCLASKVDGITIEGCTFDVTNSNGEICTFAASSDGKYRLVALGYGVATEKDIIAALGEGKDVVLTDGIITSGAGSNGYGATGINVLNGQTIDGNGNAFGVNKWGTWDSAINTTGGTIKNITVNSGMRGIFINHNSTNYGKVYLENVTINGTIYTISCDQGSNNGLEAKNSKFYGWTSYAATLGNVKFDGCTFGAGQGYNFSRPYAPTEYVNCNFEAGHKIDPCAAVTFENCTFNGVALTAENLADLVTNTANATIK